MKDVLTRGFVSDVVVDLIYMHPCVCANSRDDEVGRQHLRREDHRLPGPALPPGTKTTTIRTLFSSPSPTPFPPNTNQNQVMAQSQVLGREELPLHPSGVVNIVPEHCGPDQLGPNAPGAVEGTCWLAGLSGPGLLRC